MNPHTEVFYRNNQEYWSDLTDSLKHRIYTYVCHPKVILPYLRYRKVCRKSSDIVLRNRALANVLNAYEASLLYRMLFVRSMKAEDEKLNELYKDQRMEIDRSDPQKKDYYSVVTILKNEARDIREFVLFYQATGADHIYIYDNESEDNLLEMLDPFIQSGLVVYIKWPGEIVQTAAYRDAVRRTLHRTKWLAIVDSDEFLYPVKGDMKEQLRAYEDYPGVCANWLMFGPNGHVNRPNGLVMDSYTSAILDYNAQVNCHIKSIVQPKQVATITSTHFAMYKKGRMAVDEQKIPIGNENAFVKRLARAFTPENRRDVFRINHYYTRSVEDLRNKCERGSADGVPSRQMEQCLQMFEVPLGIDFTIKPYADIVRLRCEKYSQPGERQEDNKCTVGIDEV